MNCVRLEFYDPAIQNRLDLNHFVISRNKEVLFRPVFVTTAISFVSKIATPDLRRQQDIGELLPASTICWRYRAIRLQFRRSIKRSFLLVGITAWSTYLVHCATRANQRVFELRYLPLNIASPVHYHQVNHTPGNQLTSPKSLCIALVLRLYKFFL